MSTGLHLKKLLHEPEGLARLIKAFRTLFRYICTVLCNLQQFHLSAGIFALLRLFQSQTRIASCVCNHCTTTDDHCFQKSGLLLIIPIRKTDGCQFCFCFFSDTGKSDCQDFLVFHSKMSNTIVKIISGCEHIMFHRRLCLRLHIGCRKITGRLPLPIRMNRLQFPLCLLRYVERIGASGLYCVKLSFQPFIRIFRESLTSSRCNCRTSDNQFQIADYDRNIFQNMRKCLGSPNHQRLILCLPV